MKEVNIRSCGAYLGGRYDKSDEGFTMHWPGSYADIICKGSRLDVEIDTVYGGRRDYLSFEVDDLRAQTFAPIEGRHWYTVFLGMDANKSHRVRIIKETMAFDDACSVKLRALRTDGSFEPMSKRQTRIEFIGDSITCGEGCRGPEKFDEWLPMMFGAGEAFGRLTADALNADFNCVSISGWGVLNGWDNNPMSRIPLIYDKLCAQKTDEDYEFDFNPDWVVIALGTNDNNALIQPPFADPVSGKTNKFTDSPEDLKRLTLAARDFIGHVKQKNPNARVIWASFYTEGAIHDALKAAVDACAKEGIDVSFTVPIDLNKLPQGGMGSRYHPGVVSHRVIAEKLRELMS